MITSKHANIANEEASKSKSQVDQIDSIQLQQDIEGDVTAPVQYNVIFKLVKKRRGRVWIDNCCDGVFNPKTKKKERIWLLNGASSIWDSELKDILSDKNRYERARRSMDIPFVDSVCRVSSDDELRLEFLRRHRFNVGKQRGKAGVNSFYEYDPQEEQKDRMAKQLLKVNMVVTAKEMEITKAKKLAAFMGITFVDELGMPKSDDGIRSELMLRADSDPVGFQANIDNKQVEVAWMVRKALIDMKIDANVQNGNIVWSNGKGFISKLPAGRKPYEYLTELALTNSDEGRKFKEQLEALII